MNIIGLCHITESHRGIMDTSKDKAIYAEMSKGKWMRFKQEQMGLFVYDVRKGLVDFSTKTNNLSCKLYSLL